MNRFLFFVSFVFFSFPVSVFAQSSDFRLVTSPALINMRAVPGSEVSANIKIKNDGPEPERLRVSVMKFDAHGTSGAPRIMDPEPGDESVSWVSFPENEFDLTPGQWKTVPMTVSLPESAAFGYYYAIVFSRAEDGPDPAPGETGLSGGAAILVLLEAEIPNARRQAEVVSFGSDRFVYEFLPVDFFVHIENTGSVHLAPRGNIFVGRVGADETAILEVNVDRGNILPGSSREFRSSWVEGFPVYDSLVEDGAVVRDMSGDVVTRLSWDSWDLSRIRIGKYRAKLLLVYDDGLRDVPIERVVEFWVIPWRILAIAVVMSILLLAGLKSLFGSVVRKISRKP